MKYQFPQAQRIKLGDVELDLYEQGSGTPVIFCHGFPEIAFSWRYQMQALADAGYRVLALDQRGYAGSTKSDKLEDYDINALCGDLLALLDYIDEPKAHFVGHDWGAIILWNMALLHPERMLSLCNMSVPYMQHHDQPPISLWEQLLGPDMYIVHFNRQPGVADAVFEQNRFQFLRNMYRKNLHLDPPKPEPGMALINIATSSECHGEAFLSDDELQVFDRAFEQSGFFGPLAWYRNLDRNWQITSGIEELITMPVAMIHGSYDMVPQLPNIKDFVPNVEVSVLECGHWIQQELPEQVNTILLDFLARQPD